VSELRFGIVGFGNIGRTHAQTLSQDIVPRACLTAVVSNGDFELPADVTRFTSLQDLLKADAADVVVIATPTMTHPSLGVEVLAAKRHLVMEKPIAMSVHAARELIDAQPLGVEAAVMLNQRYQPVYRQIKDIVAGGELGRIVRFNWIMTTWYRPDVYFQVSTWRGTWAGEGGGALLNQCIHNLDILQWVLGLPETVVADAQFGKFHDITVEDEVTAILHYADGMTGTLVASTGEAPGINRLDIVGNLGTLSFEDTEHGAQLSVATSQQRIDEHRASSREMFGMPNFHRQTVMSAASSNQHAEVFNNVVAAVLDGAALATPLTEGVGSIDLANALLQSAWEDRKVAVPVDAANYQSNLDARIGESGFREARAVEVDIDMDASYR
jgi:predicted dehydrogenase